MKIVNSGTGRFIENKATVYNLLSVCKTDSLFADFILYLETGNEQILYYLGQYTSSYHKLYCADIDGDGLEEFIVSLASSGAMIDTCSNWILKYNGAGFSTLFNADGTNNTSNQINWIDTGFEYAFNDNYSISVRNTITGYRDQFDARELLEEWLTNTLYSSDGSVNTNHPLYERRFEKDKWRQNGYGIYEFDVFFPSDLDGDGVYEIIASEAITYYFELNIELGHGFTILNYSNQSGLLQVTDAVFVSSEINKKSEYEVFGVALSELY